MTPTATLPTVPEPTKTIMDATPAVPSTAIAPDTKADIQLASSIVAKATQAIIVTPEDHTLYGNELNAVKTRIKSLTEKRLSITRPMDEAKEKIMDLFRTPIAEYEKAKGIFNYKLIAWEEDQERIRKEEERKKQEEIAKREEEERVSAAAALELEAKRLAESGNQEEADAIQEEAIKVLDTPAPVVSARVAPSWTTSKSNFTQERWSAEVVDVEQIILAAAVGIVKRISKNNDTAAKDLFAKMLTMPTAPIQALTADQVFLNKQATAYKAALSIPGVVAKSNKSKAGR